MLEPDRGAERLGADAPADARLAPGRSADQRAAQGRRRSRATDVELSDDQMLEALQLGNVVIAYDARRSAARAGALQEDIAGPFDPELAAAGQAVILARRPGVGGVLALAWRRKLERRGPTTRSCTSSSRPTSARGLLDRRDAHERAQAAGVVGDVDLPDRGRAAPVTAAARGRGSCPR